MLTETEAERVSRDLAFWRPEVSGANDARLTLILEGVQDHAISMLDPSGAILTWNSAAERIKGYRLDEVRGQHVRLLFTDQDRALGLPEAEIQIATTSGKYHGDGWRLRKDGTLFYASVSLSALRDEGGQVTGFIKVTHDITDRLLAELLSDVSAILVAPAEQPANLPAQVAELLMRFFADMVAIELFDERAQLLNGHLNHRDAAREQGLRALQLDASGLLRPLIALDGIENTTALERDGALMFDLSRLTSPEQQTLIGLAPTRGLILPLLARGRLVGVLALGREQRPFDRRDAQLGQELSRRLALAMDNARLLELAHAGERRLHLALEAGHMGAWEWDIAPNRITWSPTLEDIHGIPRGSFAGTMEAYQADMHPEDGERVFTALAAVLRHGSTYHVNYRIIRPDGQTRWLDVHATLSRDATGAPQRLVGVCADITERLLAQESLIASERRFRAVFDNALDAMLISSESDHVLDANPAACTLLGIARDELIGRPMSALIVSHPSPGEPSRITAPERGELHVRRGDGVTLAVEHSRTPHIVPGQHFSVWRDVTARRQFEASLAFLADASRILTSTLDYRTALSSAVQLAVPRIADWATVDMLEPDGRLQPLAVAHVDPARVALTQEVWSHWPTRANEDFGVARVIRNGQSELWSEVPESQLAQAFKDSDMLAQVRVLGMRSVMCVPLIVRERALGAITLVAGDSERRFTVRDLSLAEDLGRRLAIAVENARLYDSEQQARRNADTANRAKDEFLATISHELRTPLNAMLGWTRILRSGALEPAKQSKALETIERNAVTQAQLIEDLLDVSRIISGKLRIEFDSVELVHLVEQVVDSLRPTSEAKKVNVRSELVAAPATILGDDNRLQQVVWNLLSNAIKFTPAQGEVVLRLERREVGYELSVSDTGSGIKHELLPLVFERFKQADSATTRAHGGLGLGLAITRHIVELHGGSIEVTSPGEGKGACFTIVCPTLATRGVDAPAPAPESSRAVSMPRLRPEFVGLKVLVVDDDVDGRELVSAVLSDCGLTVITAEDAPEALAKLKSERPDLLLSDIGLPGEDGYSLIRKVRALAHDEGADTPAAALTAYARIEDRRKALDAGYMMHVVKPVEPAELVAVVTNLLRFAVR